MASKQKILNIIFALFGTLLGILGFCFDVYGGYKVKSIDFDKAIYGGIPVDTHPDTDHHYPGYTSKASGFYAIDCAGGSPPAWCDIPLTVGWSRSTKYGGMTTADFSCIDVSDFAGNVTTNTVLTKDSDAYNDYLYYIALEDYRSYFVASRCWAGKSSFIALGVISGVLALIACPAVIIVAFSSNPHALATGIMILAGSATVNVSFLSRAIGETEDHAGIKGYWWCKDMDPNAYYEMDTSNPGDPYHSADTPQTFGGVPAADLVDAPSIVKYWAVPPRCAQDINGQFMDDVVAQSSLAAGGAIAGACISLISAAMLSPVLASAFRAWAKKVDGKAPKRALSAIAPAEGAMA